MSNASDLTTNAAHLLAQWIDDDRGKRLRLYLEVADNGTELRRLLKSASTSLLLGPNPRPVPDLDWEAGDALAVDSAVRALLRSMVLDLVRARGVDTSAVEREVAEEGERKRRLIEDLRRLN